MSAIDFAVCHLNAGAGQLIDGATLARCLREGLVVDSHDWTLIEALEDLPVPLLHNLVLEGSATFEGMAALAAALEVAEDAAIWIRDMAGLTPLHFMTIETWPGTWKHLFDAVLPILEAMPAATSDRPPWALGGSAALAYWLRHRGSRRLDFNLEDGSLLNSLIPRRNPAIRALSNNIREIGNSLQIVRPDGDIAFNLIGVRTDRPWVLVDLAGSGRFIAIEAPSEIVAKKLCFRGSRLDPLDIIDLAAVAAALPDAAAVGARLMPERSALNRARDRIQRVQSFCRRDQPSNIAPHDQEMLDAACRIVLNLIDLELNRGTGGVD